MTHSCGKRRDLHREWPPFAFPEPFYHGVGFLLQVDEDRLLLELIHWNSQRFTRKKAKFLAMDMIKTKYIYHGSHTALPSLQSFPSKSVVENGCNVAWWLGSSHVALHCDDRSFQKKPIHIGRIKLLLTALFPKPRQHKSEIMDSPSRLYSKVISFSDIFISNLLP